MADKEGGQPSARTIELRYPDCLYIGGEWLAPVKPARFEVLDCSTEQVVARVARAESVDAQRAVAAARRAFDHGPWPRLTPQERAVYLEKIAQRMVALNECAREGATPAR